MPTTFQPSFSSGELSPGLRVRSDLAKWRAGLRRATNMMIHYAGGASNRPGTQFIGYGKLVGQISWLLPFTFSSDQTYVLEFTQGAIRIMTQGSFVSSGGVPIVVATPYLQFHIPNLRYTQANDVMTFTHPGYPAYELRRLGATSWTFTPISFGTALAAPGGMSGTAEGTTPGGDPVPAKRDYQYAVTSVGTTPPDESALSAPVTINNYDLGYNGQTAVANRISWSAAAGAAYYNIYRFYQGVWSFVGSTVDLTFLDQNTLPDTTTTAPGHDDPFAAGNYPVSVGYYQQRRVFGGTVFSPLALFFTRSGNYSNMDVSQPTRPDDAIVASLVARENNAIRHLVPLQDLIVLTASAAWSVAGNNGVVTPADVVVKPQSYVGASPVVPVTINYDIMMIREKGSGLTALSYDYQAGGFTARDLSVLASHLFVGKKVVQMAWAEAPHKILWCVRDDGVLLGFTYLREQDVYAWHRHETDGQVVSVATVTENGEDVLYLAVSRDVGGVRQIALERMMPRPVGGETFDVARGWFVDCGLRYDGVPVTSVAGLEHLEGRTVAILADGNVIPPQVVRGGTVTLPNAARVVTVGLPYVSELWTLPIDGAAPNSIQGQRKRVQQLRVFMENTRGLKAGVYDPLRATDFVSYKERAYEAWGTPTELVTGSLEVPLPGAWGMEACLIVRQDNPLPCTVLAVMPDVTVGEFG